MVTYLRRMIAAVAAAVVPVAACEGRIPCDGCGTRWNDRSMAPVGSFPGNA